MNPNVIKEVVKHLPGKSLALPIREIPYPNSYVLWCNPTYYGLWKKLSLLNRAWDLVRIFQRNLIVYTYMLNIASMLFSIEFHGVTAMRYEGFTEYKDIRLNSYDSELKYVLNPNEYVFFGTPVYAMCEGEVVEVVNKNLDNTRLGEITSLARTDIDYLYGNYIAIQNNGLIYYYAGLQFNSTSRFNLEHTFGHMDLVDYYKFDNMEEFCEWYLNNKKPSKQKDKRRELLRDVIRYVDYNDRINSLRELQTQYKHNEGMVSPECYTYIAYQLQNTINDLRNWLDEDI